MRVGLVGTAAIITAIALMATGCTPDTELEPAPLATTGNAAPNETPEPAPEPTPEPTPYVPTCMNIVAEETTATLEADGFVLIDGYESKLRGEDRIEARFFDYGGVDCMWGIAAGGDSLAAFGYSEITAADASDAQAWLEANGYLRTENGDDVIYSLDPAVDVMGHGDVFVFDGTAWYHANRLEWIEDIRLTVAAQTVR